MQFHKIIRGSLAPLLADQSAVGAVNRPLLDGQSILLMCIRELLHRRNYEP